MCQESTGFSPNDLVFGHRVRGPLAVLRDEWYTEEPPSNLREYVNGQQHNADEEPSCLMCAQGKCGWPRAAVLLLK